MNFPFFNISNQTLIIICVSVFIMLIMGIALRHTDLSELFESAGSNKISHTKFWANVAYFVCTVSFIYLTFQPSFYDHLVELWMVYLCTVAGNDNVSKWISLRYGNKYNMKPSSPQEADEEGEEEDDDEEEPNVILPGSN